MPAAVPAATARPFSIAATVCAPSTRRSRSRVSQDLARSVRRRAGRGVAAAAVYAGSDLARSDALERLADGRLQVVFSVDLFNEGVDLPGIDTVLMLRPTGSKILLLQQLGRGLRIACGHFKTGRADAEEHRSLGPGYGRLDPARHFIARASGNSLNGGKHPIRDGDYLLLELVSPTNAGSITGSIMAIERQDEAGDDQYLLCVVTKTRDGRHILKANSPQYEDLDATDEMRTLARLKAVIDPLGIAIGEAFLREDIPALSGETYNPGNWNSGHVVLNDHKAPVLLVTLTKQGTAEAHRYVDHWIDEHTFHWQSQNATTPESKRGRESIEHEKLGVSPHLFIRETKLGGGTAAPFVYYGPVRPSSTLFCVSH